MVEASLKDVQKSSSNKPSPTPSLKGDSVFLTCGNMSKSNTYMAKVKLGNNKELKEINGKDWRLFWALPRMTDEQKLSFLCTMINGGLKEILYNDPKLIMDYCREPS